MKIQIEEVRLQQLEDAEAKLNALEAGGVDNWEGYDEALKSYTREVEERIQIEDLYYDIEREISEGLEEPAGHGSGLGIQAEASRSALIILKEGIKKIISKYQ